MTPAEKERKAEYQFRIAGAYYSIWLKKRRVLRWCQKNPDKQCPSKPFLARVYGRSATRNFERVWKEFPKFSKRKQVRALLIRCYRLQGRLEDAKKRKVAK